MGLSTDLAYPQRVIVKNHDQGHDDASSISEKPHDVNQSYSYQSPVHNTADSAGRIVHIIDDGSNDATSSVADDEQTTADENAFYILVRLNPLSSFIRSTRER